MQKEIAVKKFIDDVSGCKKLPSNDVFRSKILLNREERRYIHSVQAQSLFDLVREGAAEKGMKLNPQKTNLLCISVAKSYDPRTFIKLGNDDAIVYRK